MTDVDIWRAAQMMIDQHGDQAELQAAMKADEMLERNDPAASPHGKMSWRRSAN